MPTLVVIYQNGKRYYQAPVPPVDEAPRNATIFGNGICATCEIFSDGTRVDALFQEVSEEEFLLYCEKPETFTAKQVF